MKNNPKTKSIPLPKVGDELETCVSYYKLKE